MSLSLEEFARMQETMMTLKTQAFESQEKAKRFERELKEALKNADKWEKEASKANKALDKSKKAKEVQIMLEQQELEKHDFEHQREALHKNLAELNAANEKLQQELDALRGTATHASAGSDSSREGESPSNDTDAWRSKFVTLEAELAHLRTEHQTSTSALKDALHKAQDEVKEWQTKYLAAAESSGSNPQQSGSADESSDPAVLHGRISSLQSVNDALTTMKEKAERHAAELVKRVATLEEAAAKSKTEADKLKRDAEGADREKTAKLEADLKQAEEKARKKQEELDTKAKALDEKDKAIGDLKASTKDLEAKLKKIQDDQKLHQDDKTSSAQQLEHAKTAGSAAEKKFEVFRAESAEKIYSQGQHIQQLEAKVQQLEAKVDQLTKENDALSLARKLQDEVHHKELLAERAKTADALKVAESRKENLDKLAKDTQVVGEKHQEELHALEKKKDEKLAALQAAWATEKEDMKQKNLGLRQNIVDLTARSELATKLEKQVEETSNQVAAVRAEKETVEKELQSLREHLADEIKVYVDKAAESEQKMLQMQTSLADDQENLNLSRKKDAIVLKDLKRELQKEQKRCAKLESELQDIRMKGEFLHGTHDNVSVGSGEMPKKGHRRTTSGTSGLSKLLSTSRESLTSLNSVGTAGGVSTVSEDEAQLIHKMSAMQTEKATMKERLAALEAQNREMQSEIKEKSAVIAHFLQGSVAASPIKDKTGTFKKPLPPQKLDAVGLYESNKRMQTIMEETIMKNIQLQAMVDALSKAPAPAPASTNGASAHAAEPAAPAQHLNEDDMQTKL